jgi:pimeloyl-ACP methyl ester carboxylesterase
LQENPNLQLQHSRKLPKPSKVVHIGHSFGSFLTSAFIAVYGSLTYGAIITSFLANKYLGKSGMASFNAIYAGSPPFNRPSGYIVCQKSGIQSIFFSGDSKTAFTKEMLDYGDAIKQPIKQPVPIGEFASAYHIGGLEGSSFTAPVQYMLAEFDFYICGGDCKGVANVTVLEMAYPNAAAIEVAIQPNTGHACPLHNNATAGYQVTFDFLARHGL